MLYHNEGRPSKQVAKKIISYYDHLKTTEKLQSLLREVIEEKLLDKKVAEDMQDDVDLLKEQQEKGLLNAEEFEAKINELREKAKLQITDKYLIDGHLLHFKKRTDWTWKEEINDELEGLGVLHLCKNVKKSHELRYNLVDYRLPCSKYVKIHNTVRSAATNFVDGQELKKVEEELHTKEHAIEQDLQREVSLITKEQEKQIAALEQEKQDRLRFLDQKEAKKLEKELNKQIKDVQKDAKAKMKLVTNQSKERMKQLKTERQDKLADLENSAKKKLQLKELDELLLMFKENKKQLKEMEERYETDREKLYRNLHQDMNESLEQLEKDFHVQCQQIEENEEKEFHLAHLQKQYEEKREHIMENTEVAANEEETIFFKLANHSPSYNTEEILQNDIGKKFLFSYKQVDNMIICKDWFLPNQDEEGNDIYLEFEFGSEIEHDGHTLSYRDGFLVVDGITLHHPDPEDVTDIKKKDKKATLEKGFRLSEGLIEIDGSEFLKKCPTSFTKVDELVGKGTLKNELITKYRYIHSDEDISINFEIIDEKADVDRRSFFQQRMVNRSQYLRKVDAERIRS